MSTPDWQAESYHRVSDPQFHWGLKVLARLELRGDETVVDAGCGTGRLTAEILDRLPRGRVVGVDSSPNMLEVAARELTPRFGDRVRFVHADLAALTPAKLAASGPVDVVFSTATFHWIPDHDALFAALASVLRPGGVLHAQCGGAGNLRRAHEVAHPVMSRAPYAPHFADWPSPWNFADVPETRARLARAGFTAAEVGLEPAPTPFATAALYEAFVRTVVFRNHLARLPGELHAPFLAEVVAAAERDAPALTLDYVRLNIHAVRG